MLLTGDAVYFQDNCGGGQPSRTRLHGAIQLLRNYAKLPAAQRNAIVRLTAVLAGETGAEE